MAEENTGPEPTKPTPQEQKPEAAVEPGSEFPILPEILAGARDRLRALTADLEFKEFDDRLEVTLPSERLVEIATTLREGLGYRMMMSITAVDWKTDFELVYHVYRLDSAFPVVLRLRLPHEDNPEAPSLTPFWPGADFQEREVYDLMGIVFAGHPDLRRILLADDFVGHPLRKDFQQDPNYVLVPHLRVPGYAGAKRGETSTGRFLDE